ncbi:histidine phosphatase family protein [Caproiciproducens faecalis]|uniref:Histidine phosphatase family protein n=1 Tax=Caproiciproducens faecalis TaxID=2820301 RepID=A0ABS7DJX4_9FIRM|nr:histidine phosphatase family protein [Caproiciproducens faecalis]MBW7571594.1 histidine phosphatase family protein [Caproiciproducens faecalis]
MKSYTIHLIRHGITTGNLLGQYVGRTDLPLAPEGIAQLEDLKRHSAYPPAQVFYCSPLKRCLQTLQILYPGAEPTVVDGLRECDFGDWEGKTAQEIATADESFTHWVGSDEVVTPPNGESGGAFMQRVCFAFESIVQEMMRSGTSSAAIIAHGGSIMSILSAYGLPRANFYDWMTNNGCGYSLRITPGLWMRSMVAEVYETIPPRQKSAQDDERLVIDLAREAADRAFGKKEQE